MVTFPVPRDALSLRPEASIKADLSGPPRRGGIIRRDRVHGQQRSQDLAVEPRHFSLELPKHVVSIRCRLCQADGLDRFDPRLFQLSANASPLCRQIQKHLGHFVCAAACRSHFSGDERILSFPAGHRAWLWCCCDIRQGLGFLGHVDHGLTRNRSDEPRPDLIHSLVDGILGFSLANVQFARFAHFGAGQYACHSIITELLPIGWTGSGVN